MFRFKVGSAWSDTILELSWKELVVEVIATDTSLTTKAIRTQPIEESTAYLLSPETWGEICSNGAIPNSIQEVRLYFHGRELDIMDGPAKGVVGDGSAFFQRIKSFQDQCKKAL